METQKDYCEWIHRVLPTIDWMVRMFCGGVSIGLLTLWLGTWTSFGMWNVGPGILLTVVIYLFVLELVDGLSWLCKIIVGWICGYRFVTLWYKWLFVKRKKGKLQIKKAKNYNKIGVCQMAPPKRENENYPLLPYVFGGNIGLICLAMLAILLISLTPDKATPQTAFLILFSSVALIGPAGSMLQWFATDRVSLMLLTSQWMKRVIWQTNQISYSLSKGVWLEDMPEEWFCWEREFDILNHDTEWLACYRFQFLFYQERYQEAEEFAETIMEPKPLSRKVRRCLASRMLYIKMVLSEETEPIEQFYEKTRDVLATGTDSEIYRSLYLYMKYVAKCPEKAEECRMKWEKALIGQEERDVETEKKQVKLIDEKWGGTQ